jgi:hypothetical protein
MSSKGVSLAKALVAGGIVGALTSFSNSYGYAISGYTTSELSPIIAGVLTYLVLRFILRTYDVATHVAAVAFSVGIDVTTTLTSGMLITYRMFAERGDPGAAHMAPWVYEGLSLESIAFYLFACAVSSGGVLIALALGDHFIEEERLSFPVGGGSWRIINVIRGIKARRIALAIMFGFFLEIIALQQTLSVDFTRILYLLAPGTALALALDPLILFLALLLPIGSSLGVGIGSLTTFVLILPLLALMRLVIPLPTMSLNDLATSASPSIASMLIGYLVLIASYYLTKYRKTLTRSLALIREIKEQRSLFLLGMLFILAPTIPASLLAMEPLRIVIAIPALTLLYLVIMLLTCHVVGEVGIVSQSTLPAVTGLMFAAGVREAMPYVLLDPYTGTPMPQFVAATSMNVIRLSKYSGVKQTFIGFLIMLGIVIGAPLTLSYGNMLLKVYGTTSPKFPLVRWLPIIVWMNSVYSGNITALPLQALIVGTVFAALILIVKKVSGFGVLSPFAVLVGITVTPDIGILFLVAAVLKYLALRVGPDTYESLVIYSSLCLFGSTLAVIAYTLGDLLAPGV